ncbi:MAG: hypothetical protein WDZ40_03705 [Candidatus Spechtbacterales bacterium]
MKPRFAEIARNIEISFRKVVESISMLVGSIFIVVLASMIASYPSQVVMVLISITLLGAGSRKLYSSGKDLLVYIVLDDHATDMRIFNEVGEVDKELDEIRKPNLSTIRGASTDGGDIPLPTK